MHAVEDPTNMQHWTSIKCPLLVFSLFVYLKEDESHAVALVVDKRSQTVEFFDPNGDLLSEPFFMGVHALCKSLQRVANSFDMILHVIEYSFVRQRLPTWSLGACVWYVITFIWRRIRQTHEEAADVYKSGSLDKLMGPYNEDKQMHQFVLDAIKGQHGFDAVTKSKRKPNRTCQKKTRKRARKLL